MQAILIDALRNMFSLIQDTSKTKIQVFDYSNYDRKKIEERIVVFEYEDGTRESYKITIEKED